MLLNEWHFNSRIVPLSTQLLWFEGKAVPIARPQNSDAHYGHHKYKGTAPIFVTAPLKRLGPLIEEAEAATAAGATSELTMLMRRLRVYKFIHKTPPPPRQMKGCGCCFAQFVLEGEMLWDQRRAMGA